MPDPVVPPVVPPTGTAPAWFEGMDNEHREFVASKGWDKLDAGGAVQQAVIAYRQAQQLISRRDTDVVRIPQTADDPGWADVHKRLGVPEKPEDYKIEGLRFADGTAPDEKFVGHMRAIAHELKLPAGAGPALAARVMALADADRTANAGQTDTQAAANDTELRRNWGPQHDYRIFQVSRAAQQLGIPDSVMKAMRAGESEAYVRFMDNLSGLAGRMGEAELLRGEHGDHTRTMSREEAMARRDELSKDQEFVKRYVAGDANARKEMDNLARVIVGPPPQGAAPGMR